MKQADCAMFVADNQFAAVSLRKNGSPGQVCHPVTSSFRRDLQPFLPLVYKRLALLFYFVASCMSFSPQLG
ncbi:MAG TPA: hypothetical protein VIF60_18145 [Burkholderiaceae bacterium]